MVLLAQRLKTDQTARMRRLVCAFAVRKPPKTGFLTSRPIIVLASSEGFGKPAHNHSITKAFVFCIVHKVWK